MLFVLLCVPTTINMIKVIVFCSPFYFVYTKVPLLLSSFNISLISVGLVPSV